jgi:Peptidase A4 family
MKSRQTRRVARRRSGNPSALRISVIAVGTCVPVAVVGYVVSTAHGGPVADAAYSSAHGKFPVNGGKHDGGYGRGGYTMMPPGSGGSGSRGAGQAGGAGGQGGSPGTSAGPITNAATMTSQNWAGYAAAGTPGTFTSVSASWTQPTVTCGAAQTFSSFWVGLDGDGTPSVEQTGTEADCDGGTAAYQGWFEMFPAAPVFYNQPVQAGDAMTASVVANGDGTFTLTLADATQGWTQPTTQASATAQLGSAEVIAEAPSNGESVLPLSDFGTANFTDVTADNQPIGNADPSALVMASPAAGTEATPTALTGGNAFSVTFNGNGAGGGAGNGDGQGGSTGATAPPTTTTTTVPGRHHHRHH